MAAPHPGCMIQIRQLTAAKENAASMGGKSK
jgi:hypothetical protein